MDQEYCTVFLEDQTTTEVAVAALHIATDISVELADMAVATEQWVPPQQDQLAKLILEVVAVVVQEDLHLLQATMADQELL